VYFYIYFYVSCRWDAQKNGVAFFCIIFDEKFCVKIMEKNQKNTTQNRKSCYTTIEEKEENI